MMYLNSSLKALAVLAGLAVISFALIGVGRTSSVLGNQRTAVDRTVSTDTGDGPSASKEAVQEAAETAVYPPELIEFKGCEPPLACPPPLPEFTNCQPPLMCPPALVEESAGSQTEQANTGSGQATEEFSEPTDSSNFQGCEPPLMCPPPLPENLDGDCQPPLMCLPI